CVLAFAPALLASADASLALVPVCFVPMLAVYFGGRQAVISSHRAHHDALTGLPNRAALSERLQAALDAAEDERRPVAVLLLGIACFPKHGRTAPDLMRHADVALYCAKDSDATFQTYAEEDDEYSIDRLALAAQLRRGIERGELVVHYQPKVPLQPGAAPALEA